MGMSRKELFSLVGLNHPTIHELTEKAYKDYEADKLRRNNRPSTSFVASKFSGGDGCGRRALYILSNPPRLPTEPRGIAIMGMGEAAEDQIVFRWHKAGKLIAGTVPDREGGPIKQIKFEDPDHWLSGKADAILDVRPQWPAVLPVDIKSKDTKAIYDMRAGDKTWDPQHRAQVMLYTYYCRMFHDQLWGDTGLLPAMGGMLYYVSRENPREAVEYYFPYDDEFVQAGLKELKEWKELYLKGELPPRPKEWMWTQPPCKWCDFKKSCKQDIRDDVDRLEDSIVVRSSLDRDPSHLVKTKESVLGRWKEVPCPRYS